MRFKYFCSHLLGESSLIKDVTLVLVECIENYSYLLDVLILRRYRTLAIQRKLLNKQLQWNRDDDEDNIITRMMPLMSDVMTEESKE